MPSNVQCEMDHQHVLLDEIWDDLEAGVHQVYQSLHLITSQRYIQLYTHVYNFCNNTLAEAVTSGEILGCEIYERLRIWLLSYVQKQETYTGENNLHFYIGEWKNYEFSSRAINAIFDYMNRYFVQYELDNGQNINTVYMMAVLMWSQGTLFRTLHSRVLKDVVNQINRARRENASGQKPTNSAESFEKNFIENTEQYYASEGAYLMSDKSIEDFMKKVELLLAEERQRYRVYSMPESTATHAMQTCVRVLVENHQAALCNELPSLLINNKVEDIGRMYRLVSQVKGVNGLSVMTGLLEGHIVAQGQAVLENSREEAEQDSSAYVRYIMITYRKYDTLIRTMLGDHADFRKSLDRACQVFVNDNAVTKAAETPIKSPELLARYCHSLLKKRRRPDEAERENHLSQVTIILKYLNDKDVFLELYRKMLTRRITQRTLISNDVEANMVEEIKNVFPCEILEIIIRDIRQSEVLNKDFKKLTKDGSATGSVNFSITVLTSEPWLAQKHQASVGIPIEFVSNYRHFNAFYIGGHKGRTLSWQYHMSSAEIVTNCFKRKYTIRASGFQMLILLQYNDGDSFTVQQLHDRTSINMDTVQQLLAILVGQKLLVIGNGLIKSVTTPLPLDTVLSLAKDYTNKTLGVNINSLLKEETKKEREALLIQIRFKRGYLIKAAVVRTMKMRQTLMHQQLVTEVLEQLSEQFRPQNSHIKECIDYLISAQYIERHQEQIDIYSYIA